MILSKPIAIVLHHSVTRQTPEESIWEQIKAWGIEKHGIPDYHFGIGRSGTIYRGANLSQVCAHCGIDDYDKQDKSGVNNQNSFAICAIGSFEEQQMSDDQINGIVRCIRNIRILFPKVFLKLHREVYATACPGRLYPYQEIFARLEGKNMQFADVNRNRWSYPAIKKCYDKGIMKGDEFGFRPDDPITREEVAQVVANLLNYLGK